MKKNINIKKIITFSTILSTCVGISAVVVSCGPSQRAINSLFKPNSELNGFSNYSNDLNSIVTSSLVQDNGFDTFLNSKLGDLLKIWYEENKNTIIKERYEDFKNDVSKEWENLIKEEKDKNGNDYWLNIQKDILDANGGTEDTWKINKLNEKLLDDFTSNLFSTSYLNFVDKNGKVESNLTREQISNSERWKDIKFTDGGFLTNSEDELQKDQNINETYAQIQNFIFDKWVEQENPNLVSRIVFTNETPKNSELDTIFDKNKIGSDLTASYSFQVFQNNIEGDSNSTTLKGMAAYNKVAKAINDEENFPYIKKDSKNKTIDIDNILSSDTGGKLLMTNEKMFTDYDVAFTSAYAYQYLSLTDDIDNIDNIGSELTQLKSDNVMDNFIREINNDESSAYSIPNQKFMNIRNDIEDNFYASYKKLTEQDAKYGIYNVAKLKFTNNNNELDKSEFILARGTDGVHLIAIDGGSYYLSKNKDNNGRDFNKQKEFLKFRGYLVSNKSPGALDSFTYEFGLNDILKTWFEANKNELLYDAFDLLKQNENFKKLNESFCEEIDKLTSKIKNYVSSYKEYKSIKKLKTNINNLDDKLDGWAKVYSNYEKDNTPEKIGIAAKLPYVREKNGNHYKLSKYYYNNSEEKDLISFLDSQLQQKYNKFKEETKTFVENMSLKIMNSPTYSQILFVSPSSESNIEKEKYQLAINLVLQSSIGSSDVSNSVKLNYFKNNSSFNDFYNFEDDKINSLAFISEDAKFTSEIQEIVKVYYQMNSWIASDKYKEGEYKDQNELNSIIEKVWQRNNITKNQTSDTAINYYTWLYTLKWLLEDKLNNYKNILSSVISNGTNAVISWTMPVDPDKLDSFDFSDFVANPNYAQGSTTNWFNSSNTPPSPNIFNNLDNPYLYTKLNEEQLYGFNGVILDGDSNNVDSNVTDAIFNKYANSGTIGALYGYGSKTELEKYCKSINNIAELNKLVSVLENRAKFDMSSYYQKDEEGKDKSFDEKKTIVIKKLEDNSQNDDEKYKKFMGYIGNNKESFDLFKSNKDSRIEAFKKSIPLNQSGEKVKTKNAAYIILVNYNDVNKLGGDNWWSSENNDVRLGLDLNTFLAVIAMQASDSTTQSMAINDLVNKNRYKDNDGKDHEGLFIVGDKRLYDSLGNIWVKRP